MASSAGSFFRYGTSFSRFSSGFFNSSASSDSPSPCTGQELRTGVGSYQLHGTASDVPGSRSVPSRSWSLRNSHPDGWNDRPLNTMLLDYYIDNKAKMKSIFTKEEKRVFKRTPILKVHNESDWAPFNFNQNGKASGYSIDYMNLLAASKWV